MNRKEEIVNVFWLRKILKILVEKIKNDGKVIFWSGRKEKFEIDDWEYKKDGWVWREVRKMINGEEKEELW